MKVMLQTGLMFGEEAQLEVTMRELTTGDLLDAEMAAERLVMTPEGEAVLAKSPALFGYELLRRQIASVGKINGPISMRQLRSLTTEDLNRISLYAQNWESAKAEQVVSRGRLDTADQETGKDLSAVS
ncbi:phage tail assembly protein [Actinobacillus pleuropneumoniae]|uniref:phage tail assembly protein n=1 Tax=Actinobacillus pleuropneumoniae TaxID=715 RepID=UPI003514F1E6